MLDARDKTAQVTPEKRKIRRLGTLLGLVTVLAMVLALAACIDEDSGLVVDGGIRGTGKSVGPVSGFGSVIVNGTRFDTDNTLFVVNDETVHTQASLAEGMVVVVDVNPEDEDRADRISYADDLRGPLEGEFDPELQHFELLGQQVAFNSATVFHGLSVEELDVLLESDPAYLSISGWYLGSGEFLASYINSREGFTPGVDQVRVRGTISDITLPNRTFEVGGQTVDYSQNPRIMMDESGQRSELLATDKGMLVMVEGHVREIGGQLVADRIEQQDREDRLGDIDGSGIRLQGSISRGLDKTPSGTFELNGIEVRVNPATELHDFAAEGLTQGARVLVEGVGQPHATVVAKQIWTREPGTELKAEIQQVETSSNPREGRLLVGGVWVEVNLSTITVGFDRGRVRNQLSFGELRPGDFVAVSGVAHAEENEPYLEAVKIERRPAGGRSEIEGRAEGAVEGDRLHILGLSLRILSSTEFAGELDADSISAGDRLEVRYEAMENGAFDALEIKRKAEATYDRPGRGNGPGKGPGNDRGPGKGKGKNNGREGN